jgi:hypothetical protein
LGSPNNNVPLSSTCGFDALSRAPLERSTKDPSRAFFGDGAPPLEKLRSFLKMPPAIVIV